MARRDVGSISSLADQVLAEVAQSERSKEAQLAAVRQASAPPPSDLGEMLHKVAAELRNAPSDDVTFEDIENHLRRGHAGRR